MPGFYLIKFGYYDKLPGMKRCKQCQIEKEINSFYREASSPDGYRQICKECKNAKTAEWRKERRDYYNESMRAYNKKHYKRLRLQRYKLSEQEYDRMARSQSGGCAICGYVPKGKRPLAVDHDHKNGKVRELLCYGCNRYVASYDNESLHNKIIAYIAKHKD
jgi:hypothetical protein